MREREYPLGRSPVNRITAAACILLCIISTAIALTVNLVEEADWPPFTPQAYGRTQEGLSFTLMKAIFEQLNIKVDLELLPQKRMLAKLKDGAKDAATVISISITCCSTKFWIWIAFIEIRIEIFVAPAFLLDYSFITTN